MAVLEALNEKYGPAPLWVWGVGVTGAAAWYLIRRKNKAAAANAQSTQAAADQTNTNLGSASQLANLFEVAGVMPYQGGDTFVNVSSPTGSPPIQGGQPPIGGIGVPPGTTVGSQTAFEVKTVPGDTWASLAKKYGISAEHLQNYNKVALNRGGLGPINTSQQLRPGQRVVIPWANQ